MFFPQSDLARFKSDLLGHCFLIEWLKDVVVVDIHLCCSVSFLQHATSLPWVGQNGGGESFLEPVIMSSASFLFMFARTAATFG